MTRAQLIVLTLGFVLLGGLKAEEVNTIGLDTDISFVTTDGLWEVGQKYGRYRLVVKNVGWEHARSLIYLEWIYLDQNREETLVVKSVPIDEFNTGDWRHFRGASFVRNKYIIRYEKRGRETTRTAVLTPVNPGEYSIAIRDEPFE